MERWWLPQTKLTLPAHVFPLPLGRSYRRPPHAIEDVDVVDDALFDQILSSFLFFHFPLEPLGGFETSESHFFQILYFPGHCLINKGIILRTAPVFCFYIIYSFMMFSIVALFALPTHQISLILSF